MYCAEFINWKSAKKKNTNNRFTRYKGWILRNSSLKKRGKCGKCSQNLYPTFIITVRSNLWCVGSVNSHTDVYNCDIKND